MVSLLISLAAVSSYVNYRYIKLPTTVGVMLVALVASLALVGPYAGEGQRLWKVFWLGGTPHETAETAVKIRPDLVSPSAMVWGVMLPWNLLVSIALGLWLMFAPFMFGSVGTAAHSDHLVGALVILVSVPRGSIGERR